MGNRRAGGRRIDTQMRATWTLRYIAVILLALFACGALALCDGDCLEDAHGSSLLADDAILSSFGTNDTNCASTCADAITDQTAYLTRFAVTDIFRPPNATP